ncbi:hypothetical protein BVRB_7g157050 [Beta vulgaris subsp. vulgaris]|nr:hypothetical protein BVRB_7g157050 [Beta vulgaris subsp. vulgaris]
MSDHTGFNTMYDPNRVVDDLVTSYTTCVCGGHPFYFREKVKFYTCGHIIRKSCFDTRGKPYYCTLTHPPSKLGWYVIPHWSESGSLNVRVRPDTPLSYLDFSPPEEAGPSNIVVIDPDNYPSSYKVEWNRAGAKYLCTRCGSYFPLNERDKVVWHMPTHYVYHKKCAQILCTEQPDEYTLNEFLAKGNVLLQPQPADDY